MPCGGRRRLCPGRRRRAPRREVGAGTWRRRAHGASGGSAPEGERRRRGKRSGAGRAGARRRRSPPAAAGRPSARPLGRCDDARGSGVVGQRSGGSERQRDGEGKGRNGTPRRGGRGRGASSPSSDRTRAIGRRGCADCVNSPRRCAGRRGSRQLRARTIARRSGGVCPRVGRRQPARRLTPSPPLRGSRGSAAHSQRARRKASVPLELCAGFRGSSAAALLVARSRAPLVALRRGVSGVPLDGPSHASLEASAKGFQRALSSAISPRTSASARRRPAIGSRARRSAASPLSRARPSLAPPPRADARTVASPPHSQRRRATVRTRCEFAPRASRGEFSRPAWARSPAERARAPGGPTPTPLQRPARARARDGR